MAGQNLTFEVHSLAVIAQEYYMLLSSFRLDKHSFASESQSPKHSNETTVNHPLHGEHIIQTAWQTDIEHLSSQPRSAAK